MGQATGRPDSETLDLVITNALIIDWSGIFKADIGVKNGFITGIGKAGNPDVMDGVTDGMVVGANTEVMAAEGKIVTAGAIDAHVHCESSLRPLVSQSSVDLTKSGRTRHLSATMGGSPCIWDHNLGRWRVSHNAIKKA